MIIAALPGRALQPLHDRAAREQEPLAESLMGNLAPPRVVVDGLAVDAEEHGEAVVAAADPLFLASLYAYFYRYLVSGDRAIGYPMIEVGGIDLSLTEGVRLVAWGREHELTIMAGAPFANAASTFGIGEGPGGSSFAWTLRAADIPLARGVFATSRVHVARQPRLGIVDRDEPPPNVGMIGGARRRTVFAGDAGVEYRHGLWALGGHLGWKTDGYVPGASYFAGWTGGLTLATRL